MQTIVLEFEDEKALGKAVDHLWSRLGVTGELLHQKLPGGGYRLEVVSEKTIGKATLDKIGGRVVES